MWRRRIYWCLITLNIYEKAQNMQTILGLFSEVNKRPAGRIFPQGLFVWDWLKINHSTSGKAMQSSVQLTDVLFTVLGTIFFFPFSKNTFNDIYTSVYHYVITSSTHLFSRSKHGLRGSAHGKQETIIPALGEGEKN